MNPSIAIAAVFIGCCSNLVFLELLITESPSSGNLITFVQFVFISFEGLFFTSKFFTRKPAIPISTYVFMVAQFFIVNVANNYALNFNIPMPLHLIFRSGSLIANLVLGVIILKKSYTVSKYVSVVMITVGIILATIVSAREANGSNKESTDEERLYNTLRLLVGITLLLFALYMSARMGIYQETVYAKFGKHPSEALFYNHFLPLPAFLFLSKDIYSHVIIYNQSTPIFLPLLGVAVPKLWLFLIGNTLTQYVCIRAVFILTTECTSLSVTLVVTLRKFLSLLFSIVYFSNPFTLYHWLGTAFVFSGTLLFTDAFALISLAFTHLRALLSTKKKTA
ncbi:UDP-xylose and UDP-N-acetylglucosamine transporter [Lamellibrachia satsuma]|nr:UDP-xylose and UDP-N-acetylglucosamine transporter [Lamellibrachia satsuma]